jgi:transcription antitermination factor NusG
LKAQGVESLLPVVRRLNQWKDRKKTVDFPLFPGYCFARCSRETRMAVLKVPGVVRIIGSSGAPEPIPDSEIDALKRVVTQTLSYDSHPYLREGMRVRIMRGPLEGMEGVLARTEQRHRVVIAIHLIQQAAAVEVDSADLSPV